VYCPHRVTHTRRRCDQTRRHGDQTDQQPGEQVSRALWAWFALLLYAVSLYCKSWKCIGTHCFNGTHGHTCVVKFVQEEKESPQRWKKSALVPIEISNNIRASDEVWNLTRIVESFPRNEPPPGWELLEVVEKVKLKKGRKRLTKGVVATNDHGIEWNGVNTSTHFLTKWGSLGK